MGNWFIETKDKTEGTWFLKALWTKSRRFYIKETHLLSTIFVWSRKTRAVLEKNHVPSMHSLDLKNQIPMNISAFILMLLFCRYLDDSHIFTTLKH